MINITCVYRLTFPTNDTYSCFLYTAVETFKDEIKSILVKDPFRTAQ